MTSEKFFTKERTRSFKDFWGTLSKKVWSHVCENCLTVFYVCKNDPDYHILCRDCEVKLMKSGNEKSFENFPQLVSMAEKVPLDLDKTYVLEHHCEVCNVPIPDSSIQCETCFVQVIKGKKRERYLGATDVLIVNEDPSLDKEKEEQPLKKKLKTCLTHTEIKVSNCCGCFPDSECSCSCHQNNNDKRVNENNNNFVEEARCKTCKQHPIQRSNFCEECIIKEAFKPKIPEGSFESCCPCGKGKYPINHCKCGCHIRLL